MDQSLHEGSKRAVSRSVDAGDRASTSAHDGVEDQLEMPAIGVSDGFRPRSTELNDGVGAQSPASLHLTTMGHSAAASGSADLPARYSQIGLVTASGTGVYASGDDPPQSSREDDVAIPKPARVESENTAQPVSPFASSLDPPLDPQHHPSSSQTTSKADLSRLEAFAGSSSFGGIATDTIPSGSDANIRGPQHPYALYPQNTVTPDTSTIRDSIGPAGFNQPGMNFGQPSSAGAGPPQPIVSPYEQIEQPPPYSRYADMRPTEAPVPATPGETAIPLQDLPPIPQSPATENHPNRPRTLDTPRSSVSRHTAAQLNSVGTSDSQSTAGQKRGKKGRRRVCQGKVPVWALILAIVLTALLIVLVTGLAVGIRSIKNKDELARASQTTAPPPSTVYQTLTTFDASLVPSAPSDLPPPPGGTYSLFMGQNTLFSTDCIGADESTAAWSCDSTDEGGPQLQINVTPSRDRAPDLVHILVTQGGTRPLRYGAQPPSLYGPQKLSVAMDEELPDMGHAYFFQTPYDKLVILESDKLGSETITKRAVADALRRESRPGHRHAKRETGLVKPGDEPWYCFWNDTVLEGFIFATKDVSSGRAATTLTTPTGATVPSTSAPGAPPAPTAVTKRNEHYPTYPRVVKLLEVGSTQPQREGFQAYCQQMRVLADMRVNPVALPDTNEPRLVYLNGTDILDEIEKEEDDDLSTAKRGLRNSLSGRDTSQLSRREVPSERCFCAWLIGV